MTNIFLSVLKISVSIGLIVAMLILLTSLLNKRYATKWKYLIWIFLALRLLVPFNEANVQSIIDTLSQIKTQTVLESEEEHTDTQTTQTDVTTQTRRIIVEIPTQMTTPIAIQAEKSDISITLLDILALVWIIGSLIFISVHLISYLHYKRQVMKSGTIIRDTRILNQISELKLELNIRCKMHAVKYSEAGSPMMLGFLKPVLVLPEEQYSSEELFFILKHELVHLKRKDVYFKLLFVAANAVHWFNPLIWIMQKEAIIDMELSCDERVIQGANYAVRKAYTETLLATLHKQCAKRTILSTQLYGGKQIMKKRFKNILLKNAKKNGIAILICAVILTINLGTLADYSIAKEDIGNVSGQSGNENIQLKKTIMSASKKEAQKADKVFLKVRKEGEVDKIPATLFVGKGYSIYLTDDNWQLYAPDAWFGVLDGQAVLNQKVQIWISHFKNKTVKQVKKKLAKDGYISKNSDIIKQKNGDIYKVKLNRFKKDVWAVFYRYPVEAEEGWGAVLSAMADTFAVSIDK